MSDAFNQMLAQGPTPIKFADPINQMAQLMQLKNAQQTGVVNQMAIDKGQRALDTENAVKALYAGGATPTTNQLFAVSQEAGVKAQELEAKKALDSSTISKNDASANESKRKLSTLALVDHANEARTIERLPVNEQQAAWTLWIDRVRNDSDVDAGIADRIPTTYSIDTANIVTGRADEVLKQSQEERRIALDQRRTVATEERARAGSGLESGGNVQQAQMFADGSFAYISKNGNMVVKKPDGVVVTGADAARVVRAGNAASATNMGNRAKEMAVGKDTAKAASAAYAEVDRIRGASRLYDQAISAIDSGSQSGAINELFPSVFAPTVNLEYIRDQLGLAVIAGTTFGALSEAELRLAMNQGLPTGLEGPKLKEWVIGKKAADAKLSNYLEHQAVFLEGGGSRGDWLKITGAKATDASNATATATGQASPEDAAEVDRILGLQ
jgi:hypothetical protein